MPYPGPSFEPAQRSTARHPVVVKQLPGESGFSFEMRKLALHDAAVEADRRASERLLRRVRR